MKVPRKFTPGTDTSYRAPGYLRPASADLSAIGEGLNALSNAFREKKTKQERFDVRKALIEETNFIAEDFEARKKTAGVGAPDFAKNVQGAYSVRGSSIVEKYRGLGYSDESVEELELGLAPIYTNSFARGLEFQGVEYGRKIDGDLDSATMSASQYVAADPLNNYTSGLQSVYDMIDLLDITDGEKTRRKDQARTVIKEGGRKAFAEKYPELTLQKLMPKELLSVPGQPGSGEIQGDFLKGKEGFRETAYWDVNHFRVGYGSDTITLADGTVKAVKQGDKVTKEDAERDFARRTVELQTQLAEKVPGWEKLSGGAKTALISVAYNYGIESSRLESVFAAAENPETLAASIEYLKNDNEGINHQRRLDEAKLVREGGSGATDPVLAVGRSLDAEAKTGIALLDDSTGAEWMQMVDWAQSHSRENDAELKASIRVAHENATSGFMNNGEFAGVVPTETQYKQAFGDANGGQMFAELQAAQEAGKNAIGFKTMTPAAIRARVEAMKPNDPATQAVDQRIYEAMQKVEQTIIKQRADDPGAYVQSAFPKIGQSLVNARTLEERRAAFTGLANAHKQLGTGSPYDQRPFSKQQAAEMANAYKTMPAQNRVAQLHQWIAETNGTGIEKGFWRSLHESGAGADLALMATLYDHPERDFILKDVIEGKERIANDKSLQITKELQSRLHRDQIGSALTVIPSDYSNHLREVTAALYIDQGGSPVMTDNLPAQQELWAESFRRAVGGVRGKKNTGFYVDENSTLTILPPTITSEEFENWKYGLTPQDVAGAQYTGGRAARMSDIIDNYSFVMVDTDTYKLRNGDGQFLVNARGEHYQTVITPERIRRVKPQAPRPLQVSPTQIRTGVKN